MLVRLLKIIAILILLFFSYQFARAQGVLKGVWFEQIDGQIEEFRHKITGQESSSIDRDLEKLGEDGLRQVNVLADKAKEAGSVAQEFVQEVVKIDENKDQNLSEKAFEYGRYIYCQEVVKQYETSSKESGTF